MKKLVFSPRHAGWLLFATLALCAPPIQSAESIQYQRVDNIDRLWLAQGFMFTGYEVLLVTPLRTDAIKPRDDKETDRLRLLERGYAEDMARGLERYSNIKRATAVESSLPEGARKLVLDTELLEFSRGSSSARYGLGFGAGMPYIKIRGTFHTGDPANPLAIFEMDEKGDWFGSGYSSNQSLQERASMELGKDLGRFMEKVANGEKIKYRKAK